MVTGSKVAIRYWTFARFWESRPLQLTLRLVPDLRYRFDSRVRAGFFGPS